MLWKNTIKKFEKEKKTVSNLSFVDDNNAVTKKGTGKHPLKVSTKPEQGTCI